MDNVQKQDSSKIFQSIKVCTKVCIYFAPIFCLKKICPSYKQLPPPQRTNSTSRGRAPQFENLWTLAVCFNAAFFSLHTPWSQTETSRIHFIGNLIFTSSYV
jgi:hypothetical protein